MILLVHCLTTNSGWIKCLENDGKNMSFKIEDDEVFFKYNSIWNREKNC